MRWRCRGAAERVARFHHKGAAPPKVCSQRAASAHFKSIRGGSLLQRASFQRRSLKREEPPRRKEERRLFQLPRRAAVQGTATPVFFKTFPHTLKKLSLLANMEYTTGDGQFLRDKNNKLVLKEFAVFYPDFHESGVRVATFAPPYEKEWLPHEVIAQNNFITNNFHGLEWNDGEHAFKDMSNILWSMTHKLSLLYVKGTEKSKILQTLLPHLQVVNIEDLGCPSFDRLPLFNAPCENEIHCMFRSYLCASKQAKRLGLWLIFFTSAK